MKERTTTALIIIFFVLILLLVVVNVATGMFGVSSLRTSYYSLWYKITKAEDTPEKLQALHSDVASDGESQDLARAKSARCIACHGSMVGTDEEIGPERHEERERSLHQSMLTSPLLKFNCIECHPDTTIGRRSPRHATVQVDRKVCGDFPCHNQQVAKGHEDGEMWLLSHPRMAREVGFEECDKCHETKELNFCGDCHDRGGMRASSHRAEFQAPVGRLFPKVGGDKVVRTRWKGFHFVFAREALEQQGVRNVSASNLPLKSVEELPCKFCHVLKEWCTRCHIKHAPNWLDPDTGHPARIKEQGSEYCFDCHDVLGSKCLACHQTLAEIGR